MKQKFKMGIVEMTLVYDAVESGQVIRALERAIEMNIPVEDREAVTKTVYNYRQRELRPLSESSE
jgi:hypothetical protein